LYYNHRSDIYIVKQEEIAKFITQRLKERNLTQVQLSKQINRY